MKDNKMKKIFVISSILCAFSNYSYGADLGKADFLKYIPENLKIDSYGDTLSFGSGIGLSQVEGMLDGPRGSKYHILEFSTDEKCDIQVLRETSKGLVKMGTTTLKFPLELDQCSDVSLKDLDLDGKPELVVETVNGKIQGSPVVFKWNGSQMVDISPTKVVNGTTSRSYQGIVKIANKPIQGKLLLIDFNPLHADSPKSVYSMKNGSIVLEGTYGFLAYLAPSKTSVSRGKVDITAEEFNPSFPAEGQYTLTVKNVSDHNRPVRAEVTVNGSVVLKPQDFCSASAHPKNDKGWWGGHDDDDDIDFDHCKRCVPKNDVYAIVNLKTANEIKVKVYGMKESKIQLTLVKK